ncbi:MAG: hypothetical protein NDF53_05160 [archaeon GB-1867-097]|nr:hypothetical protein [Candidatus Verstraetearchaeota archaeon]MCS7385101.1 hypothetical protein [Candidatus Culexmicrobium thermophilum]
MPFLFQGCTLGSNIRSRVLSLLSDSRARVFSKMVKENWTRQESRGGRERS